MSAIAIMQPYLFPYLGYYQMAAQADQFVFLDDAAFIVRGFVNRNRILLNKNAYRFTVPVLDVSQNRAIKDHYYMEGGESLQKLLRLAYKSAPHLNTVLALVGGVFEKGKGNVAGTNALSIRIVLEYLGMEKQWFLSSELMPHGEFKGSRWLIEMCLKLSASRYLNLPGGKLLYDPSSFDSAGIILEFVEPQLSPYQQMCPFVPGLSVIDALMWCDPTELRALLQCKPVAFS